MWFPYSLPSVWKAECVRERVNESFSDQSQREFIVAFQLRNPVVQEWSVELHLNEPQWVVHQGADGREISIGYYPNEQERLSEIICKVHDTGAQTAVRRCYDLVSKSLSYWAADHGRGFAIGGLRIADLKHDARWRVLPHWPSAQDFAIPALEGISDSFWPVAELYREARTSSSDRHRFLCCYTILSKWARDEEPFGGDEAGKSSRRVTQEHMVLSGMLNFHPELEGVALAALPDQLGDWREAALRFFLEGSTGSPAGQSESTVEWAAAANLIDLAAHLVLSDSISRYRGLTNGAGDDAGDQWGRAYGVVGNPSGTNTTESMEQA